MKKLSIIATLLLVGGVVFAQTQFSSPLKSNLKHALILIEQNNLEIQGIPENETQISIEKPISMPDVAEGLKRIYKQGLNDNSSLGLNITEIDTVLIIREVCNCYSGIYRIKIPQNLNITMVEYATNWGKNWSFSNFRGNISINSEFGNFYLKNLSGNITAKTRHGKIEADLSEIKEVSLTSTFGKVMLELNEDTKSELRIINCKRGDVFTDFSIPSIDFTQDELKTALNGGGNAKITLRSDHGDIYLKKKKKI